jgi:nitroimidazol reductase NimA-like FMN-containing flavoprotein (pyridoxamine 5'-phosphate oxidase superfamily)
VDAADELNRLPEKGVTDRSALDALLDSQWVGVLSTVADGEPLAVPMLYARDGDRLVLHGSTGAGALRRVAAGAPAVLTVFALDALVVAPTTFESSINYRSATVRGRLTTLPDAEREATLDRFSEVIVPGRTAEVRASSRKELAASLALALPITQGGWLLKVSDGWPATPEEAAAEPDVWSGLVPVRTVLGAAVPAPWSVDLAVPPSVSALVERGGPGATPRSRPPG